MPGHKGSAFFARLGYGELAGHAADLDITEIPGADDLRHPDGIIKTITDRYAALYGSRRAFISVNGSSALIMAAIMTCVRPDHKLLASADSHISVKNGAELAGVDVTYIEPQSLDPWGNGKKPQNAEMLEAPGSLANKGPEASSNCDDIPAGLSAAGVAEMLDADPDIDAVILPSPNYFGIVSDIKAVAEEVHRRGRVLIVDQAHGAHLKMFSDAAGDMLPVPAEECGADIVIVSTHKTMASFTQTAAANIFGDLVDPDEYEKKLLVLESTSPSYVLMGSLAANAEIMEKYGDMLASSWRADLDWFYNNVKTLSAVRVITRDAVRRAAADCNVDFDDTKIVADFSKAELTGEEAEKILMEKGIFPEFSTGSIVMFLTGIGNVRADYELLLDALGEIEDL